MLKQILELDTKLSEQLKVSEKPGLLRNIAAFLAHSGDSWFWGAGLIILWLWGNSFWKEWAVVFFGGIGALATAVLVIKFTVKRRRPEGEWGLLYRSTDPHSFPSGHAARAFLLAVLGLGLGPAWLAVILAIWAPLVALARVSMGVHYLSDIIAGMLLGTLVGVVALQVYAPLLNWIMSLVGIALW
ncbi:MAG: phosphatase PAP2 family protein [Anaerolineales bacterium]|nr:phosphatase PAP2 family protein [Anaerolineales bacterium]